MGRNLADIVKNLPTDRQKKIANLSQIKVEEMIAHAATLTDFRKAVGKTQAEVAKELGIKQNAVSQLEKRSDTYVSTLRRFLKSLGMTLELSVVARNGSRIDLPNFLPWQDDDSPVNNSIKYTVATTSSVRTRKVATKSGVTTTKKKISAPAKHAGTLPKR
jgi:transcriptional regulator with XRE-family HTH domain